MQNKEYKASVLAVTLIVMAIILASALSISAVSVRERKSSIGASKSSMAYQTADTGIEYIFGILPGMIQTDSTVYVKDVEWGSECDCNTSTKLVECATDGYKFQLMKITDYAAGTTDIINCDDGGKTLSDINKIKSIGIDPTGQTQRAVEADVPVAP